jgi:hypothetical protein
MKGADTCERKHYHEMPSHTFQISFPQPSIIPAFCVSSSNLHLSLSLSLSLPFKFEESCCFSDWKGDVPFQEREKKIPLYLHPSCQRKLEGWRRRASTERVISEIHDVPISCSSSMRDSSSSLNLLETVQ